jgi:hypothetical protein
MGVSHTCFVRVPRATHPTILRILSGVNYFFCLTTIISPDQRQLLLTFSAGAKRHRAARGAQPARVCFVLFLGEKRKGGGKVGNPLLVFHFSIRLAAGAVEMWESRLPLARFPRGSWEAGETCFWFSTLSTAPPFPQLSSLLNLAARATHSASFTVPSTWLSACCFFVASSTR